MMLKSSNPQIRRLFDYISSHFQDDSEFWYGGYSRVNELIRGCNNKDLEELASEIQNWDGEYQQMLSNALTAEDGTDVSLSDRSYIYGNILISINSPHIFNVLDDFQFLEHADTRIKLIIPSLQHKLEEYDFENYDRVNVEQLMELLKRKLQF